MKEGVSKLAVYPCDNCGAAHIGQYVTEHVYGYGYEVDFVWADWQGNERLCPKGHRRDPCHAEMVYCSSCDWNVRRKS